MQARKLVLAATFLLSMLLYVDRVCISAAKDAVSRDLRLSDREMGWAFSAFSLGYALFQIPAGWLADRFGPRRILAAVVVSWSVFTALTAAVGRLSSLLLARFLFGAGEAGAFPGMSRAIYAWQPISERGLAHGINFSAARLGAAFALPGVAMLVSGLGWRQTFVLLGLVGLVWAVGWLAWFRDDPADHPAVSDSEKAYILEHRQQPSADDRPEGHTVGTLLGGRVLWLLMGQYFASNFTFFFCLTWLVPHFSRRYELDAVAAGRYAMLPLLAGVAGNWVGGVLVDWLYREGFHVASRRVPAVIGFVCAALGMVMSARAETPNVAAGLLALSVFGADMTLSPSWSVCVDLGGRQAGAVSGTMNMAGNLGAFATALAFPYLQSWTDSTVPFFMAGAMLNALAAIAWCGVQGNPRGAR